MAKRGKGGYTPQNDDYFDDSYQGYPDGGYQDDGYYDDGYYDDGDQNGYYDQDGYYDDGDYSQDDGYYGDYDDGYGGDSGQQYSGGPSMASRASGNTNTDPYGYQKQQARQRRQQAEQRAQQQPRQRQARAEQPRQRQRAEQPRQSRQADYDSYSQQPRRKKRKKRHGFRKFLIFLLFLAAILAILYFVLFRAPAQSESGTYTRKANFFNILICATDLEEARTDTMMIATLDEDNGSVSLTSLPRDTIVDNGESVPKLNGVYGLAGGGEAGAEALMDQVEKLLGFRPDGYMVINYQVFKDAVDAMGGVKFNVPMDMVVDNANDPNDVMEIAAGEQTLNGDQALGVCRYRYGYLMADIQRQYVQQSFLKAMAQQCMAPSKWIKLPAVYRAVMNNTVTDLKDANLRYLALHVLLAGTDNIQQNTLPGEGVDYNGASCYGLYGQSTVDMVNSVMNPYEEDITLDDVDILTVSGGELVKSTSSGTAFDASTYQYN